MSFKERGSQGEIQACFFWPKGDRIVVEEMGLGTVCEASGKIGDNSPCTANNSKGFQRRQTKTARGRQLKPPSGGNIKAHEVGWANNCKNTVLERQGNEHISACCKVDSCCVRASGRKRRENAWQLRCLVLCRLYSQEGGPANPNLDHRFTRPGILRLYVASYGISPPLLQPIPLDREPLVYRLSFTYNQRPSSHLMFITLFALFLQLSHGVFLSCIVSPSQDPQQMQTATTLLSPIS